MSIQAYQISLELEVLLHKIHYSFNDKQEEIRHDPYAAIEKALSFYISENSSMKEKALDLLSEIESLSGKSIDKIFENDDEKKLLLTSIKKLQHFHKK